MALAYVFFSIITANGQPSNNITEAFRVNDLLGRGINVSGYEGLLVALYKAIKEAGFKNVRIPIHPFNQTLDAEAYTLKSSFVYADRLEFYVDDNRFHAFKRPSDHNNRNWPYHSGEGNGFNIIMNLAVGGTMGGKIDYADFPMVMEIDYVRVYQR